MQTKIAVSILIVEDCSEVAVVLKNSLRDLGFNDVVIAGDGHSALDQLNKKAFALVMADLVMEPMSGFGLIATIRKDKKFCTLPVIAVSGKGDPDSVLEAKRAGATAYIVKPYSIATLKAKLTAALGDLW